MTKGGLSRSQQSFTQNMLDKVCWRTHKKNHCTEEHKEQQAIFPSLTNGHKLCCAGSSARLVYLINSSKSSVQFNGGYNMDSPINLFGPGKLRFCALYA